MWELANFSPVLTYFTVLVPMPRNGARVQPLEVVPRNGHSVRFFLWYSQKAMLRLNNKTNLREFSGTSTEWLFVHCFQVEFDLEMSRLVPVPENLKHGHQV